MIVNFADAATIGKREEQQDSKANLKVDGGYQLYVLADGMGGQIGGAMASREVAKVFLKFFESSTPDKNPLASLKNALQDANNRLTEILRESPAMNGMGTTLIAVLHEEETNKYWYVSVGDSPLYIFNPKEGIRRINVNHAYYEDLLKKVELGEISQKEADEHPNRHAITSAVMGKTINLVDESSGVLADDELMLIASDGVQTLNDMPGGELEALLSQKGELVKVVDNILNAVESKNNPYQDNTTLILIEAFKGKSDPLTKPMSGNATARIESDLQNIQKEGMNPTGGKDKEGIKNKKWSLIFVVVIAFVLGLITAIYALYFIQNTPNVVSIQQIDDKPKPLTYTPSSEAPNSQIDLQNQDERDSDLPKNILTPPITAPDLKADILPKNNQVDSPLPIQNDKQDSETITAQ